MSMLDLEFDPVVTFQRRHYIPLAMFLCFILPIWVVVWSGECFPYAIYVTFFRYILTLNFTWLVSYLFLVYSNLKDLFNPC